MFQFDIPVQLSGVDAQILHPRQTWQDANAFDQQLHRLGKAFTENFNRFTQYDCAQDLVAYGPQLITEEML